MSLMARELTITLCFSPAPRTVFECQLTLPAGSTLAQAVSQARQHPDWPGDWSDDRCLALSVGVWGRKADWGRVLHESDRVELYRPLRVDPKVARRERFNRQGARRAGLFAQKRPGAAAGY